MPQNRIEMFYKIIEESDDSFVERFDYKSRRIHDSMNEFTDETHYLNFDTSHLHDYITNFKIGFDYVLKKSFDRQDYIPFESALYRGFIVSEKLKQLLLNFRLPTIVWKKCESCIG